MTFLLNFVHFEAIFAYSETILLILNLILQILKLILQILKQKSPTDVVEDLLFTVPCRMWRPVQSGLQMRWMQSAAQ